jgi:type 1 glutamine amidotransferase
MKWWPFPELAGGSDGPLPARLAVLAFAHWLLLGLVVWAGDQRPEAFRKDGMQFETRQVACLNRKLIRVLIVDGQQNVFHNWKATTPEARALLEQTGRFEVKLLTTPLEKAESTAWSSFRPDFRNCDVVLLNYHGQDWPEPAISGLETFVHNGGGLMAFHAGGSSFEKRESFNRMIGLAWRSKNAGSGLALDEQGALVRFVPGEGHDSGHGPRQPFAVRVRQPDHPVMKGMPIEWVHGPDELWHGLRGPAENLQILATALSPETKLNEPIVWTVQFGKGRVFVTALGHDTTALRCPGLRTLLARGCEWAASGAVTLPVSQGIQPSSSRSGQAAAPAGLARRISLHLHIGAANGSDDRLAREHVVEQHQPESAMKPYVARLEVLKPS